jgi:alanyl-tRNA synthetase
MAMTGNEIRKSFIQFFQSKDHKHVRSSSLIPHNDPTILFTNAGMNQFKDYFLGNQKPDFTRAVTSQKSMRVSGKHNDLENVGRTDRHHTFFEMLGNFSFGDYFKEEAIAYAWEYLTEVINLQADKLVVSVYTEDDDAFQIWHKNVGIPKERIGRLGEKDNFWSMGDIGPCGPCSEIHYQLYPMPEGKTVQRCLEDDDGTFLEIWNLVFMQFNREADGTMTPLPKPSIDTGMGLERIAAVAQNELSNYGSDILSHLVDSIEKNAPDPSENQEEKTVSARVIADHIRAAVFLITDGVIPSNEGRGYVLRRIIRRAARHGKELGYQPGFFAKLVPAFIPMMTEAYPELVESQDYVGILLTQEEKRFSVTLNQGIRIITDLINDQKQTGNEELDGKEIFKLYDTYGFPVDLAEDILQDHGLTYNRSAYDQAMEEQRERARSAQDNKQIDLKISEVYMKLIDKGFQNSFVGYDQLEQETVVQAIVKNEEIVNEISAGDEVEILLKETPFYAEAGGQVGDRGEIVHPEFRIVVKDTRVPAIGLNLSIGTVASTTSEKVQLPESATVTAKVAIDKRTPTEFNHTATHLLQAALRTVLGDHVKQAGSLVNEDKLRFDFSHYAPVTTEQLQDIEALVNEQIRNNIAVSGEEMPFDNAMKTGAMAIFGEKYGDDVRVISAGNFSKELCGGCHTSQSGNIGMLKITSEESIAAGVRRIEALTGEKALKWVQLNIQVLTDASQRLKVPMAEVGSRLEQMEEQAKQKDKRIEYLQEEAQRHAAEKALTQVDTIGNIKILVAQVDESVDLKSQSNFLLSNLQSGVVLLSKKEDSSKISIIIAVSKDLTQKVNAGSWIKEMAPLVSGKGGGSPNMAQCGGSNPSAWEEFSKDFVRRIHQISA